MTLSAGSVQERWRPPPRKKPNNLLLLLLIVQLRWLPTLARSGRSPKVAEPSVTAPVLLSLDPRLGPRDGGTRVTLNTMGVNRSLQYDVKLVSVEGTRHSRPTLVVVPAEPDEDGELEFVTPDLISRGDIAGLLVSLCPRGKHNNLAGPVFFRVYQPTHKLAPSTVEPCCTYQLSGGSTILVSGSVPNAPTHHATVRFKGKEADVEVVGQVVEHEWVMAEAANTAAVWHVFVTTPPWPQVEQNVSLSISWNDQQYSTFPSPISFKESKSLFGEVAYGISEHHLLDGKKQMEKKYAADAEDLEGAGPTEEVAVVSATSGGKGSGKGGEAEKGNLEAALLLSKGGDTFILSRSNDLTHFSEDLRLVKDLFLLTIASMIGSLIAVSMQAPTVIGFLVGGIVVGPGCLDMIAELVQIESLAELGVCLLLFCIGLELSVARLVTNVRAAASALLSMVLLCILVILLATYLTETSPWEALCIGIYASLASTPLAMRAIPRDTGTKSAEASQLLTIVVTQDVILAALLALMPVFLRQEEPQDQKWQSSAPPKKAPKEVQQEKLRVGSLSFWELIVSASISILALILVCRCLWSRSWRLRVKRAIVRGDELLGLLEPETFVLSMLTWAFSLAWSTENLGLSVELGAFLAGFLLSCVAPRAAQRAEHVTSSLRDVFVAWFFASIGLVVNPSFLMDNLRNIIIVVIFVFVLKLVTGFLPLWLLAPKVVRSPALSAMRTSWILTHISEFGFVLASKGKSWGVLSRHVYLLLIGVNVVSLCLAPWLFKLREVLLPKEFAYRSPPVAEDAIDPDAESAPSPAESPNVPKPACIGRHTHAQESVRSPEMQSKHHEEEEAEYEYDDEEAEEGNSELWELEPKHNYHSDKV